MNSKNAYELFSRGKTLVKKKKNLKAIMLFEKAKDIEPEKGSIREALARAYYNCGLYSSAKEHFSKAIKIDASNDYAYFGLGLCLIKEGKFKTAMGHLKIAASMQPENEIYKNTVKKYDRFFKK
jgi:tetratricopeptide (TPR) repeat protein